MKNIERRPLLKAIIAELLVFAFFCLLLWRNGAHNLCFQEQMSTFFYKSKLLVASMEVPGGLCTLIADFIQQFFVSHVASILITSAILTLLTHLMARTIRYVSETLAFTPLALLPSSALVILHYNIQYMYSGTIALVLMLFAANMMLLNGYRLRYRSASQRIFYAVAATFFLYAAAGAVALLFDILVILATLFKRPKEAIYFLICPALVVILAYLSVRSGLMCDMSHALLPEAYFTHRLPAPSLVFLPWAMMVGVIAVSCILRLFNIGQRTKHILFALSLVAAVTFAILGSLLYVNPHTERFKDLNCYMSERDWDKIIESSPSRKINNLLELNCLNVALAEKGILTDSLFKQPCIDIRNIYISDQKNPAIYMLLSDIYYSMGHIALAQRYAFEANESLDNNSPRMLQRLVDTNIIFGNYKVAEKYIKLLESTRYYADWAKERRNLLSDEAVVADPELSLKRACIFPDNRFSGIKGLDDDLLQIARHNPAHKTTLQYLGALYLLTKNSDKVKALADEFYADGPLPVAIQECLLISLPDSVAVNYAIDPAVKQRYEDYKHNSDFAGHEARQTSADDENKYNYWYFKQHVR